MKKDSVARVLEQWQTQKPELPTDASAITARIHRLSNQLRRCTEEWLKGYGLAWETLEIVFALRRAGPPCEMKPTALYKAVLLTSGAMTNRMDRAEQAGLVTRHADPQDRRGIIVRLTARGVELADEAAALYFNESAALYAQHLSAKESAQLATLLSRLLHRLETSPGVEDPAG